MNKEEPEGEGESECDHGPLIARVIIEVPIEHNSAFCIDQLHKKIQSIGGKAVTPVEV
jgi:hypothetical protein